jgi:DNA-binding MarR family transcriptional regulator
MGARRVADVETDSRILGNPGTPAFQVDRYPFYLINRLVIRYNSIIEPQLRAMGVDIRYWSVLMILGERDPRGVRDIADAAVIPLSTMTRMIQRMATAGLVDARMSDADARVTEVSLTPEGQDKLRIARAVIAPVYAQVIGGVGDQEFLQFLSLLKHLHQNLAGPAQAIEEKPGDPIEK